MSRRARIIMAWTVVFGVGASTLIGLFTGNAQVGLHLGFWTMLPFAFWLESRLEE
jgi:hypothetical protein